MAALNLRINVDAETARRDLRAISGELDSMAASGEKSGSRLGSAMSGLGKAVGGAALGIAALGAGVVGIAVKGGISRAMKIEDAQAKLKGLGNDAAATSQIMQDALTAVKGTSFGLGDAATIAASAVAAGVKPGEDLSRYLRLTANAASLAGTDLASMGQILNKVTTRGKLSTEEINQLSERGIPIMTKLAESYGVSTAEMSKMVTNGEVDAKRFAEVLEGTVGNAAVEMGKTTRGSFQNMTAAASRFGESLIKGVFPLVAPGFNSIGKVFDALGPVAETLGTKLGEVLAPAAEKLGVWTDTKLIPALERFGTWVADSGPSLERLGTKLGEIRAEIGERLAPAVDILSRAFTAVKTKITDDVVPAFETLGRFVRTSVTPAFREVEEFLRQKLFPAFAELKDWVGTKLGVAFQDLERVVLSGPLGRTGKLILAAFSSEGVQNLVNTLTEKLAPALDEAGRIVETVVTPKFDEFKKWIKEDFLPGIEPLTKWLNDTLKGAFNEAARIVNETLLPALDRFKKWATERPTGGANEEVSELSKWFGRLGDIIGQTAGIIGTAWLDHATRMWNVLAGIGAIAGAVIVPIFDYLLKNVWGPMIDYIRQNSDHFEALGKIISWVATIVAVVLLIPLGIAVLAFLALAAVITTTVLAMQVLFAWIWNLVQAFWDWANGVKDAVGEAAIWAVGQLSKMIDWIRGIGSRIGEFASTMFVAISDAATGAKDWVVTRWDEMVGFVAGLPGRIGSAAVGMWDGIRDAFRNAINWVIDKWNGLRFTLPTIPGTDIGGFTLGPIEIPRLATGGIITSPTLALVGEAGPEAVIPLHYLDRMGNVYNINVTSTGLAADSPQVARDVVAAIRAYESRNGRISA